jgi:tRNA dimethylallyltransferase
MKKSFILVQGPTGVGKSDTVTEIGNTLPIEIINCDMGQFYKPVAIGTAKPDTQKEKIPHHLFDVITEPKNLTVAQYRKMIVSKMEEIWERKKTPVLVGGSGFYGKSLFFPPKGSSSEGSSYNTNKNWQDLFELDPIRAQEINENDHYRIQRAFELITKGITPSDVKPVYSPPAEDFLIIFLTRDRKELYSRINNRTEKMLSEGWIEEVEKLMGTEWEAFFEEKKLIGYPEIFEYLKYKSSQISLSKEAIARYEYMQKIIQKKTRHYAKRQMTFWRMFQRCMKEEGQESKLCEINLSEDTGKVIVKKKLKAFSD